MALVFAIMSVQGGKRGLVIELPLADLHNSLDALFVNIAKRRSNPRFYPSLSQSASMIIERLRCRFNTLSPQLNSGKFAIVGLRRRKNEHFAIRREISLRCTRQ